MPHEKEVEFCCRCGDNTAVELFSSCSTCGPVQLCINCRDYHKWELWLEKHPECKDHKPHQHDSTLDPEGCGHCQNCHYDEETDGHWIGCPGC